MSTTITPSPLSPTPNILINHFCEIDQANEGSSVSLTSGTAAYVVDGWKAQFHSSSAVVSAERVADGPLTFPNSLKLTVSTGASVGSLDYLYLFQPIEANNITDLAFGATSAQTLSLTFWAKSSIGSYIMSGVIQNAAGTRSFPFTVTVPSSATWTQFFVVIPGDVAGTWVTSGTAAGMYLCLVAAAGSGYQATPNTWQGSVNLGTAANTNTILSTTGATFQITGAKLEASPIPTPYGRRNFEDEFARCQRYYEKSYDLGTAIAQPSTNGAEFFLMLTGGSVGGLPVSFATPKRSDPSVTAYSSATGTSGKAYDYANSVDVTANIQFIGQKGFMWFAAASAGSDLSLGINWTADARL
jgi:cyclophilin family peptidyl-prolyl cis-trans isomerase